MYYKKYSGEFQCTVALPVAHEPIPYVYRQALALLYNLLLRALH